MSKLLLSGSVRVYLQLCALYEQLSVFYYHSHATVTDSISMLGKIAL